MSASLEQPDAPLNGQFTPNHRPCLPRSNSIPSWHKNASVVSLRSPRTLQPSVVPAPSLRKRHSTYVFPAPPDRAKSSVPVPGTSPIRPRNPVHVATPTSVTLSRKKNGSKDSSPSLATGAREEVTPWEFQPGPVNDDLHQASSVASDSSSPVSSRQSLATGTVSKVAPWEMYPTRRPATSRSLLTSGFVEEVTPWELHPVPTVMPIRSTLATGPVEDVTPWELSPAPPSSESSSEKRFSTRGSTSSNQGKGTSEVTQLRRRKSTSAKAKPRFTFLGYPGHSSGSRHPFSEGVKSSAKSAIKFTHTTSSSRSPLPSLAPLHTTNEHDVPKKTPEQNFNVSTSDRTILQELKRNLEAKDAQFVIKGEGSSLGSSLTRHGKKHHAFPPESVPYPRSYGREVIDLDNWETVFCQDICDSLTWHVFETPPTKVLDLGCGTGTWILNCARMWKDCHFIGLDSVPLQPDLHRVGSLDLSSRITWVHTNFLESLPFPDGEFDFVHVKRIALGVPEDKWDGLFQEIIRVMKPGGAYEMLEEDLFFPGQLMDSNDNSGRSADSEKRSLRFYPHRQSTQSYSDTNFESPADSEPPSFSSNGHSPETPTTATFPATPSRSNSPVADVAIDEDLEKEAQEILSHAIGDDYILPLEENSFHDQALNFTLAPTTVQEHLPVEPSQLASASSVVSFNPSPADSTAVLHDETNKFKARTRSRAHSLSTFHSVSAVNSQRPSPVPETDFMTPPVPLLLRTLPKPPHNPRDHSLLEVIYTRLLESRSINMSPLTFLANYVAFYFRDMRTRPPLELHFPFESRKNHPSNHAGKGHNKEDSESERLSSDDTDDARDAILPSPVPRATRRKHSRRVPAQKRKEEDISIVEEKRHVGTRGLIHYAPLDEPSGSVVSPSNKSQCLGTSSARFRRGSLLPKANMHMDSKTLNLHLALRAAEIVACSENMWEWVQKFSAQVKTRREREAARRSVSRPYRSGSGSIELPARRSAISVATSSDPFESSILDLTREEFDGLISRFEMDMRDNCDIKNALGERFSWHVSQLTVSEEREAFEKGCDKWDKWEQEQLAAAPSHVRSYDQHRHPPSGACITTSHSSSVEGTRIQGRPVSNQKRISNNSASSLPTRRLSRSMCVFVAWKSHGTFFEHPWKTGPHGP